MNTFSKVWIVITALIFLSVAQAEQDLPIVIVDGERTYQSQLNYVTAYDTKTKKVIWETVLYDDIEPEKYIFGLEQDVQWIVIIRLEIDGILIKAVDSKNRVYFINKHKGKIEKQE